MSRHERVPLAAWLVLAAAFVAAQAVALWFLGQPWVCECGVVRLWHGIVFSGENSQQFTDWYTLSHLLHGLVLYLGLWFLFPRTPARMRFALAVGLEAGWEVFENTPLIIDQYRQQALAAGYVGDSIVNSIIDTLAAAGGFLIAQRAPVRVSVVVALFLEALMIYAIRDSLVLNMVQLVHPSQWISSWQAGG